MKPKLPRELLWREVDSMEDGRGKMEEGKRSFSVSEM